MVLRATLFSQLKPEFWMQLAAMNDERKIFNFTPSDRGW